MYITPNYDKTFDSSSLTFSMSKNVPFLFLCYFKTSKHSETFIFAIRLLLYALTANVFPLFVSVKFLFRWTVIRRKSATRNWNNNTIKKITQVSIVVQKNFVSYWMSCFSMGNICWTTFWSVYRSEWVFHMKCNSIEDTDKMEGTAASYAKLSEHKLKWCQKRS